MRGPAIAHWTDQCADPVNSVDLVDLATAPRCPADLDGDGDVGASDLGILLGQWGTRASGDLDGDGVVGSADLAILLGEWGTC